MGSRLELQQKLEDILGNRNVYFQLPSNIRLKYPAIVYELSKYQPVHAEDNVYLLRKAYDMTLIETVPESAFAEELIRLPYCTHDRSFVSDNLYHNTFTIYY